MKKIIQMEKSPQSQLIHVLKQKMILLGAKEKDLEELESLAYDRGYKDGDETGFEIGRLWDKDTNDI